MMMDVLTPLEQAEANKIVSDFISWQAYRDALFTSITIEMLSRKLESLKAQAGDEQVQLASLIFRDGSYEVSEVKTPLEAFMLTTYAELSGRVVTSTLLINGEPIN